MDYEREMGTFDDYMRGVVMRYGFDTADAFNDMLEADHDLLGMGDDSDYTMLENDVWLKPQIDTVWTGGLSFSVEGATWTFSRSLPLVSLNTKRKGALRLASIPALTRASVSAA